MPVDHTARKGFSFKIALFVYKIPVFFACLKILKVAVSWVIVEPEFFCHVNSIIYMVGTGYRVEVAMITTLSAFKVNKMSVEWQTLCEEVKITIKNSAGE